MTTYLIPRNAIVLVCDGRKAKFLRNVGTATSLELQIATELDAEPSARTSEQGSDAPGRVFDRAGGGRSAMEQTDWHALDEERFLKSVASRLEAMYTDGELNDVFVVAPPKALAVLRASRTQGVADKIRLELAKDLTKHPLSEVARLLSAA
jgi:protein required for attachment to host cells